MIYATVNMTIGDYSSTCDNKILLYRGDKNVEIRIVMKGNKFTVLDSTYAQMIIRRPSATSVFSEPAPIQNDTVIFVITEDMIDELKEIGEYTFQIRLYDDTMTARATLPPCNSALIIERPIAVEGEAAVNLAIVNDSAVMLADTTSVEEDIFTEDNKYNRTIWVDGDLITDARLNKIEDALYYINENGGGGGGGATAPYISTELPETVMVGSDENFDLHLYFNSPNMGKGTLRVFINDADVMSVKIDQGDSTTVVSNNLFTKGTNRVVVYVLDRVGVMSNSLVFYIRYGSTEISSDFDPYSAYDYGATIRYYFTPTALDTSLALTFYMSIDGQVQQGVNCTSDTRGYYTFPTNLSADSHYCEAYVVDSNGVKSNVLSFNLIILGVDTLVVASDTKEVSVEEGEQVSLDYKVYMKYNTSFIANIYVDDVLANTGSCNADFNYYKTSSLTKGIHTVKLEVFDVTETHSDYIIWTVTVSDSTYEMLQPVNAGAMFIGTAVNKTNTDERKQYFIGHDQEGNEVLGTLSNFAYNSESGWVNDELIISGNSHVEIPVQPLANNAKYGFTLDIEFTSKQIGVTDAEVLTLWNDETNCGVKITTEKLILQSSNGNKCDLYFTDNEKTHVMFVIDRQELKAKIYLNGVMCEAFHLNDYTVEGVAYLDDFTVNSNIILGGLNTNGYCKIRNLRVYQVALTTDEIMNNFISCEIDKAKQRELSEFQKGNDLPTLYVYCDFSGLGKDDKKPCKIVYNSTNEELYGKSFNLNHKQSQLQYQGTSSMAYPIKNYRLNLRDENGDKWYYTLPTAQPECRFTLKADFMSSGHWTNTGMAKFINDKLYNYNVNDEKSMNPFKWNHVQNGGKVNDFRETITGFPCRLILVNDGETPLNTGQNEPTPGNTKDMGIFNFNNDKDNVTTLGFNSDIFPNCASYEVTANSDTSAGAFMSYKEFHLDYLIEKSWGHTYIYTDYIKVEDYGEFISKNGYISSWGVHATFDANLNSLSSTTIDDNTVYVMVLCIMTSLDQEVLDAIATGDISIGGHSVYFNLVHTHDSVYEVDWSYLTNKGLYKLEADELAYLKESFELRHPDEDDVAEDWGYMGVESPVKLIDYAMSGTFQYSTKIHYSYIGSKTFTVEIPGITYIVERLNEDNSVNVPQYGMSGEQTITLGDNEDYIRIYSTTTWETLILNGISYKKGEQVVNNNIIKDPYETTTFDNSLGLKALIDWVDNCTDEEFVRDFDQHFHKDYTLRYFCLVTLIGAVDNLGKNMMLDTADNKIYFPRFYDIDTICSYDNSGQLKFDVDIEMEQGYWNTSSSRLWTRVRDLMHDDIVTTYNDMRQNGVSYENMMKYIYDEQIAKIPQAYYNKDYDVKYAPFADSYIGMAHGDTYEHVKRWLKQRFAFVDTLFDYAPSYNNDILTIRANTTELMTLEIETYTPVYLHLSWYNGQMDKKKIDGKVSVEFSGKAQAATDQEVLIYGGSNVKSIKGIQSANPNRLILGSATKLTELDASNCPLLAEINMNKANLSPHEYLNKVNLSNCPLLEGNLRLNNSPLIQELDIRGTKITGMNLPSSIRNLQVLKLPNTMTELTLNDAGMLHTLEFDEGVALQSISMTNCNALTNVVNFDLLQTPSITLNNSYNSVAELYFRDTTNLSLSNMSNLERVIFTPNNEYETFELINVANAPDYKVTTFNCPKLSTFMTTAPYRESYNDCDLIEKDTNLLKDISPLVGGYVNWQTGEVSLNNANGTSVTQDYIFLEANNEYTLSSTINGLKAQVVFYDTSKSSVTSYITDASNVLPYTFTPTEDCYMRFHTNGVSTLNDLSLKTNKIEMIKHYGDIQPNTTFTANSIDISNTQFTDVKLLCTTDTNTLKLPTTVKNFYCDSSFDLDTDYLEDGEYDVVHGELVEPYTTDYEGEVVRMNSVTMTLLSAEGNPGENIIDNEHINSVGQIAPHTAWVRTDYIPCYPNTPLSVKCNNMTNGIRACFYAEDKSLIEYNSTLTGSNSITSPPNTSYVIVSIRKLGEAKPSELLLSESFTPNLIPSSADGSLIFSMYAPSNAVAPASGTWDLHGLEFDNFHTFGMNNDVKPSEDLMEFYSDKLIAYNATFWGSNSGISITPTSTSRPSNILILLNKIALFGQETKFTITAEGNKIVQGGHFNANSSSDKSSGHSGQSGVTSYTWTTHADTPYLVARVEVNDNVEWVQINNKRFSLKNAELRTLDSVQYVVDENVINVNTPTQCVKILDKTPTSISMPARYDDYNITIKNANISPKTHNTMLYPLLVNEDNPITGILDYTNYAGKHLSWSFAYTDEEYVNIIQPKNELLNSYEYKYNAFYDTEYEFDNPYEIARYTSSASGVLPSFNKEFTYTYDEIDNGDGTYTTKVYADSLDNSPTSISFATKSVISVDKLNTSQATNLNGLFQNCNKLAYVNTGNWDTSNVTNINNMFHSCSGLTSLDVSGFDTSNVTTMSGMFYGCSGLTSLDVSVFDTSNVTNMNSMFDGCRKLTTLDVSGFVTSKVTEMTNMFNGCNKLTSLDVSGFDTKNVINMRNMFQNCNGLTSLDVSGLDTSNVTDMSYMFNGCSGLTSLDVSGFDTKNVIDMGNMFQYCSKLTSLDLSGFDTSNSTDTHSMFHSCSGLTSLDVSGFDTKNVTDMHSMFLGCSGLTSLDLSGFDTGKVTNMDNMFNGCSGLTSLDVSGFDTKNVINMCNMFQNCNGLTSLDLSEFDTSNVTTMEGMFSSCWSLKEVKGIEKWNCSKVDKFGSMFQGATAFGGDLDLRNWKVGQNATVTTIYSFMNGCTNLKSVDMSGWVLPDSINFANFMANQGSLHTVRVIGWSAINIQNLCSVIGTYVGGTIYGDIIIDESKLPSGWVYDNVLLIAKYTANATGVLPTFNTDFTGYTTGETDNGDGTYTVSIATDSLDNLPASISFRGNTTLLTVDKLNTSRVTNMSHMFNGCRSLTTLDLSGFDTSNVITMNHMFCECISLTSLDLSGFDTSNVITMNHMFYNCSGLTSLDLSGFDTSKVTNMQCMFQNCGIESIDLTDWDVSKVTNMQNLFCWAKVKTVDFTGWDTSSVTNMQNLFYECTTIETIIGMEGFDTSNATNISGMFYYAMNIKHNIDFSRWVTTKNKTLYRMFGQSAFTDLSSISDWDTSSVTEMNDTFYGYRGTSLDLSKWDTSNVVNMSEMFNGCKKLTSLDLSKWDASKVENMFKAFYGCSSITELDLSKFTNVKDWGSFCRDCTKLVSITGLDISKYSTNFGGSNFKFLSFQGCTSLRSIKDVNVSFTSTMAKAYGDAIDDDNSSYWMGSAWSWFNGLTNLVDITFTGQVELYDTMTTYMILKGCDTTKFTDATWRTFVSIFPTTSTSKTIIMGSSQAILDDVPDEIKLALTQKGYTLGYWA